MTVILKILLKVIKFENRYISYFIHVTLSCQTQSWIKMAEMSSLLTKRYMYKDGRSVLKLEPRIRIFFK